MGLLVGDSFNVVFNGEKETTRNVQFDVTSNLPAYNAMVGHLFVAQGARA